VPGNVWMQVMGHSTLSEYPRYTALTADAQREHVGQRRYGDGAVKTRKSAPGARRRRRT